MATGIADFGVGLLDRIALRGSGLAFRINLPVFARVKMGGRPVAVTLRDHADWVMLHEVTEYCDYADVRSPDPGVIVDVGANIGFSALYFANRFPNAIIHAIEPAPGTFARLVANTRRHPSIRPHNFALGGTNGAAMLKITPNHYSSSFVDRGFEGPLVEIEVEVKTLNTFLDEQGVGRVGLLNLDVAGHEVQVFEGMDPGRINQLVAEMHYDITDRPQSWFTSRLPGFEFKAKPIVGGGREMLFARRV